MAMRRTWEKSNPWLAELGLSTRASRLLSIYFRSLEDLCAASGGTVLSIPGLGRESYWEIIDALAARGLDLNGDSWKRPIPLKD